MALRATESDETMEGVGFWCRGVGEVVTALEMSRP